MCGFDDDFSRRELLLARYYLEALIGGDGDEVSEAFLGQWGFELLGGHL